MRRVWLLSWVLLAAVGPAAAFRSEPGAQGDAKRFGLDKPEPPARVRARRYSPQAVVRLDQLRAKASKIRYSTAGTIAALNGPIPSRGGPPEAAARGFLYDYREALEIDPGDLKLEVMRGDASASHLLFSQTHEGLPVEFARVKLHLSPAGDVIALHSSHQPDITAPALPAITAAQAARAVAADLRGAPPEGGTPVYLPVPKTGEIRLAWKFKAGGDRASWLYYIDAQTGEVLLRYNDLRFACPSGTWGRVTGDVYDIDPSSSAPGPQTRPMPHQKVWQYNTAITTFAVTDGNGDFCNSGTPAKIFTALQGPYVSVSHFNKLSVHTDNGGGTWVTAATPVSSPSPYPNGSRFPNSVVYTATLNPAVNNAMGMIAHFDFFQVGVQDFSADISDDDQVHVYDSAGKRVGSYIGNRRPFNSAAAYGCLQCAQAGGLPAMRIDLQSNQSTQGLGFRVNVSSFLTIPNNPSNAANPSNVVWSSSFTADATIDEINLFYHLNMMHDYFIGDVDKSSAAWISSGVVAMAHFGPNLGNAFFDPDHNNFAFGDLGNGIALDATVIHHEYVHYVVDKIFPIINFGQNGAISEALADYFSGSSLNSSSIGRYVGASFGSEGALRELACTDGGNPPCHVFPNNWYGEVHDDALPLSQALWELRSDLKGALGNGPGQSCADNLVFKALFFFPDSFQEFLDAMLLVDNAGTATSCGAPNVARSAILNRFSHHGITEAIGFAYEPNDGIQSAVDISTLGAITASLYPAADLDYYGFGTGPGRIEATLRLPASSPGSYYDYGMTLIDNRFHDVAEAYPTPDINPTLSGGCPFTNCQTTASQVVLTYDNPSPNQFYLVVSGGLTDQGSNSATATPTPYTLTLKHPFSGALEGGIVDARVDADRIDFTVKVSTFVTQNLRFSYAQLRDHRMQVIPNTRAEWGGPPGFLSLPTAPVSADGKIRGTVLLQNFGGATFTGRYPSLGTVYLEVFAINELQWQATQHPGAANAPGWPMSLGLSSPLNLTTQSVNLTPYNNLFNPDKGQATTLKYEIKEGGRLRLQLFSRTGALVATLFDGEVSPGKGTVDWNGRNLAGQVVASGVYTLRLEGPGGAHTTRKVIVVK